MRSLLTATAVLAQLVSPKTPQFYRDVKPILDKHCVGCHHPGEIGPMPLVTYKEARPWASAIREAVKLRKMPPWFADPSYGEFANDPRLTDDEIQAISDWSAAGAPAGSNQTSQARVNPDKKRADLTIAITKPFAIPANAVIDYQYFVFKQTFETDKWVTRVEVRPSNRSVVHHAVLYVRSPQSAWLKEAKPGIAYAPSNRGAVRNSRDTKEDILAVYTPGAPAVEMPPGMAKKIPAGASLILQVHYTSKKVAAQDQPRIDINFAAQPPNKRILTLQMGRDDLRIPPGDRDYRASVSGTLPQDALLISLFPHMHLRGKAFDFEIVGPKGHVETLLRVSPYDFNWQLNYILKTPRLLPKGTRLRWTGYFDNSPNNPSNPDPTAEVTWGEQSWEEMMIGFFDVAVNPSIDKAAFFVR